MNQIPYRLLIIDDEAAICDFVSGVAEELGYEVRATGDPDKFLSLLGDFRPSTLIGTDKLFIQAVRTPWNDLIKVL